MSRIFQYASLLTLVSTPLLAQNTPWLPAPTQTNLTFSYVHQEADELFAGEQRSELGADLKQSTKWLSVSHGINENLAVDGRVGYSDSDFSPAGDDDGITDTNLGVTWRFLDEAVAGGAAPSLAVRAGAIIAGDYDTGQVNSIGDGVDGAEISLLAGRGFSNGLAVSADAGFRYRSSDVPNESFVNISSYYSFAGSFTGSLYYQGVFSNGDLDIGSATFTPDRFPETEENIETVGVGLFYQLQNGFGIGANYATVVEGRNTADADIYALSLTKGF